MCNVTININFFWQRKKADDPETITLVNGSLSGLLAHPKFILDKGKHFTYIILLLTSLSPKSESQRSLRTWAVSKILWASKEETSKSYMELRMTPSTCSAHPGG